jgi:hypothetical protein
MNYPEREIGDLLPFLEVFVSSSKLPSASASNDATNLIHSYKHTLYIQYIAQHLLITCDWGFPKNSVNLESNTK